MKYLEILFIPYLHSVVVYTLQLFFFPSWNNASVRLSKYASALRMWPVISMLLSMSLFVIVVNSSDQTKNSLCASDDTEVNMDIGGIGILLGLFSPCIVLFLVLFSGHWKADTSGAKELCIANTANTIYLTINFAKSLSTLNYREAIIAFSSLDGLIATISMSYSDKDVLAARTLVSIGFLIQIAAFVVLGIAIPRIHHLSNDRCAFYSSHPAFHSDSPFLSWMYFVIRIIMTFAPVPAITRLSRRLHDLEHAHWDEFKSDKTKIWERLPATLLTNYLTFASITLFSGAVAFTIPGASNRKESWQKLWSEWGQSAAFIVAVATILHVCYSFARLFRKEAVEKRYDIADRYFRYMPQSKPSTALILLLELWIRQPFGHLRLYPVDQMLLDDIPLQPYGMDKIFFTPGENEDLKRLVLERNTMNDKIGIRDDYY